MLQRLFTTLSYADNISQTRNTKKKPPPYKDRRATCRINCSSLAFSILLSRHPLLHCNHYRIGAYMRVRKKAEARGMYKSSAPRAAINRAEGIFLPCRGYRAATADIYWTTTTTSRRRRCRCVRLRKQDYIG